MCGIAGFSLTPADQGRIDALDLARGLLVAIEPRGRDASGAVWTEGGSAFYHKAALPARRYVGALPLSPLSTTAALHTRFATQGDPKDNRNNHPFALPGITGVHNGCIWNDDAIFDRLGVDRTCETDSEAIFALLAYDTRPTVEALADLRGDASIAWIETDRPRSLHLARLSGRPLALGRTKGGSLLFSSTLQTLRLGASAAGVTLTRSWNLPEWSYLRVWQGQVRDAASIDRPVLRPAGRTVTPRPRQGTWDRERFGYPSDPRDNVSPQLRLGI
jgi:glucosamine 6-phosphate synthetase-like amidotransferase/phosphosugar isomerase protein